jgi:zinc transport system ATP-binding protein
MSAPYVNLSGLSFGPVKAPVLDEINLSLEAGHFMGIIGPNGAGKSTLLSIIAGLLQPSAGRVELFGKPMHKLNRHRLLKQVGFLNQLHDHEPRLPLRVQDVVAMGSPDYTSPLWKLRHNQNAIMQALEQVEMADLADRDFRHLSGGQRQRIRLARALVRNPKLLLLDEPSAALDSKRQDQLYALLRKLSSEQGMTIIMVEHDIAAITAYVDSVACLNRRIHYHAMHGDQIPEDIWHAMYGDHIHIVAHDAGCIGCAHPDEEH